VVIKLNRSFRRLAGLKQLFSGKMMALWLSFISFTLATFMTQPFIGLYALKLGAEPMLVGVIYAAHTFTALVSRMPFAWLSAKVGRERMIMSGLLMSSVGMVTYALSTSPLHMVLGSMLRGIGFSSFHPSALSLSVDSGEEGVNRTKSVSYVLTAPPLGMTIGPALGAAFFAVGGYQVIFLAGAAIAALGSTRLLHVYERPSADVQEAGRFREVFSKNMLLIMFSRLVISYAMGAAIAFLPVLASRGLNLHEVEISLLFTLWGMFNFLGRPVSGYLAGRLGESRVIMLSIILLSSGSLLFSFIHPALLWIGMAFSGLGLGLFLPSSVVFVANIVPAGVRTMGLALLTTMMDVGTTLGSFGSGLISSSFGFQEVFGVAAAISISGTAIGLSETKWVRGRREAS